jgi:hypothetical protein
VVKSKQSLVKCTLYQTRYDRRSGLSLSAHFLKHANMAAYLEPRPSEVHLIEAIRAHYPISVQCAMLTNQLQTIEQALDLLRRVELMEQADHYQKPHHPIPNPSNQNRSGHNPAQVRQIQFSPSRNRSYGYRRRNRGNNNRGRGGEPSGGSSDPLNPNAPPFQGRQENDRPHDDVSGNR